MNVSDLLRIPSTKRFFDRMWRSGMALLLAAGCMTTTSAGATGDAGCNAPEDFGASLPELSTLHEARESGRRITIAILGSPLRLQDGDAPSGRHYSDRLAHHLSLHWPGSELNLVDVDDEGQTAEEVAARIPDILARYQPDLLVWESGAVDAARGVDVAEFANAIEAGILSADAAGTALVLVDPWYEEGFPLWVDPRPYVDTLDQVVRGYPVLLFPLHELTRHWDTEDTRPRRSSGDEQYDSRANDCVAALLAEMISVASSAGSERPLRSGIRK